MTRPKGTLLIIGGSEDRGSQGTPLIADDLDYFQRMEILERFVEIAKGIRNGRGHPRIEVIATASTIPDEMGKMYRKVFAQLGIGEVGLLDIRTRADANAKEAMERVEKADAILFSGGDQFRLGTILGCTEVRIGFIPAIVSAFLQRKATQAATRELLLTGRIIRAEEARQRGLISRVLPDEAALDAALTELTGEIAAASASAVSHHDRGAPGMVEGREGERRAARESLFIEIRMPIRIPHNPAGPQRVGARESADPFHNS